MNKYKPMNYNFNIDDLALFCTVVKTRSFTKAASLLGVSPAYTSKHLKKLELQLHTRLVHRTTHALKLTRSGDRVYAWATQVLSNIDSVLDGVSNAQTAVEGDLRICTTPGFGMHYICNALSILSAHYPNLQVTLELFNRSVNIIEEGFDIEFHIGPVRNNNLVAKHIANNYRILCASPDYLNIHGVPENIADLSSHQCILVRRGFQSSDLWRLYGPNGLEMVRVHGNLFTNHCEVAEQWAIASRGIVLRSSWDLRDSLCNGRLVRILHDYYESAPVVALYPERLSHSAKARACIDCVTRYMASFHKPPIDLQYTGNLGYPKDSSGNVVPLQQRKRTR